VGKRKADTKKTQIKIKLTKEEKILLLLSEQFKDSFIKLKKAKYPLLQKWDRLPDPEWPTKDNVSIKAAERSLVMFVSFLEKMKELESIEHGDLVDNSVYIESEDQEAPYMAG
jgi:hypothetical protein